MIAEQLIHFARKLKSDGLIHSKIGNLSIRDRETIHISRSGSMLDELKVEDIIRIGIDDLSADNRASSDLAVHRAVYSSTTSRALIHAHPPYAVAESLISRNIDLLITQDIETRHILEAIPLVSAPQDHHELAASCAEMLIRYKALIVRGHGVYAAGDSLESAYFYLCSVEHACRIRHLCRADPQPDPESSIEWTV